MSRRGSYPYRTIGAPSRIGDRSNIYVERKTRLIGWESNRSWNTYFRRVTADKINCNTRTSRSVPFQNQSGGGVFINRLRV